MYKRIGVNIQAKPADSDELYACELPGVLLLGAALDPGMARRIAELSPWTRICMRFVGGDTGFVADPSRGTPRYWADNFVEQALPAFARVRDACPLANTAMGWNEVQIGDLREFPPSVLAERAKRYAEGELRVLQRLKAEGFQTIGFNLSRGTHHVLAYDAWSPFAIYEPVMADPAMDFFGYHAYWDAADAQAGIAQILSHNTTTFRYRPMYEEVGPEARKPIVFTEFGEDGPGGYKVFSSIQTYVAKMGAVETVWNAAPHFADRYVYIALMFLAGRSDDWWKSFDPTDNPTDYPVFKDFLRRPGQIPPVPTPDQGEPTMAVRREVAWDSIGGIRFNPEAALFRKALGLRLGKPEGNEAEYTNPAGTVHVLQGYAGGYVDTAKGHWDQEQIKAYDWLSDAEIKTPPDTLPPPEPVPTPVPVRLTSIPPLVTDEGDQIDLGFRITPYVPQPGERFYGLVAAGGFKLGQGTQFVVQVIDNPAYGIPVTHAWDPERKKSETFLTDGRGEDTFVLGPGSDFTPGEKPPPDWFYVSDGPKPDGTWPTVKGDIVHAGQVGGHTEAAFTFQLMIG